MSTDSSAAAQESRAPTWQPGVVVGGKYRIDRPIGQGGMGTVYAALNEETGRRVAVKSLLADLPGSAQAGARLMREARMVGRVHHPNVIDVYDVGHHEGTPFLVMELLDGESLDDLLERGRIAPGDAIRLIIPAMRGIAAAHALGVVHRDLKPDNIFLCKSKAGHVREVKVLDFGISKTYGEELNDTNLTRSGAILGTPKYMAPEQLADEPVDRRTDVYALGVILYELIAGCLPFDGDTFALLASNKLTGKALALTELAPDVDPALEAVIMRAIARDPQQRPADVPSFARALETFAPGADFGTGGIPLPETFPRPERSARQAPGGTSTGMTVKTGRARTRTLLIVVGLATMLATGIVLGWSMTRTEEPLVTPLEPDPPPGLEHARPTEPAIRAASAAEAEAEAETGAETGAGAETVAETETERPERPTMRRGRSRPSRGRTGMLSWDDF